MLSRNHSLPTTDVDTSVDTDWFRNRWNQMMLIRISTSGREFCSCASSMQATQKVQCFSAISPMKTGQAKKPCLRLQASNAASHAVLAHCSNTKKKQVVFDCLLAVGIIFLLLLWWPVCLWIRDIFERIINSVLCSLLHQCSLRGWVSCLGNTVLAIGTGITSVAPLKRSRGVMLSPPDETIKPGTCETG